MLTGGCSLLFCRIPDATTPRAPTSEVCTGVQVSPRLLRLGEYRFLIFRPQSRKLAGDVWVRVVLDRRVLLRISNSG